jgi:hypothetical protein
MRTQIDHVRRRVLFTQLGLPMRIPLDMDATYPNQAIPLGVTYQSGREEANAYLALLTTVRVRPSRSDGCRGGRGHRVFITCPLCSAEIPMGRLHQHYGTRTCKEGIYKA